MPAGPTARTMVAGVIGHPVRHSLSPVILNAAFEATATDWVYAAFEVAPGEAHRALDAMRVLGLGGMSVTMPHKRQAWEGVERHTPTAQRLGVVNCIFRDGDLLVGDSTDGPGFVDALHHASPPFDPEGATCVVVGAGGAARAIIDALAASGAGQVVVVNRTESKAREAVELAGHAGRVDEAASIATADLVVNATSVGMRANRDDDLPFDPDLLRPGTRVVDIVYEPLETPLLTAARARGLVAHNGVAMLVHQAAHQFTHWTGLDPPLDAMVRAVAGALGDSGDYVI